MGAVDLRIEGGLARSGLGVHDGELDLVLVGVEVEEQLVYLVDDLGDAGVGTVDLVDDDHEGQSGLQGLAQHEAGLGPGSFRGVDEQHDAVDHREGPFDLAAEVGVPGGVDDVDLDVPVSHRGVLGQDGDALLPFEVHGVHDPFDHLLVGPEGTGLVQEGVDEGRLAMIDVGDDGDVAQIGAGGHGRTVTTTTTRDAAV